MPQYRAIIKYRFTDKNASKASINQITIVLSEKTEQAVITKIQSLKPNEHEIKIVSIIWKNWWGNA